ncbi:MULTISPECIES: LPXTG cell wall anchor domain-containing protein [unclassified Enterococcus]|uniref:LPXTG cell wall anchor domain-containing protein n=1 Tax=unclassified Enterococcus TaxID=2608891 RepID=UPI001556E37F|nr:LPXTG cell wall anchor domain-containing protein [Enterococcus sp. MMGLQ5-2]MBS7584195.1 LPXTG cell wall anchor domain-containing protein [Enterococcus sp. MMGLQ5-1]NPD12053.1 LPXTG cell wall anchor domain-containing protein [Enterococcus sp. MMGLQ5-1]NPD36625.1 LPXTG cell wall anchor domain-containing protein [Enterococcus sp. MMGLQ5-2]
MESQIEVTGILNFEQLPESESSENNDNHSIVVTKIYTEQLPNTNMSTNYDLILLGVIAFLVFALIVKLRQLDN